MDPATFPWSCWNLNKKAWLGCVSLKQDVDDAEGERTVQRIALILTFNAVWEKGCLPMISLQHAVVFLVKPGFPCNVQSSSWSSLVLGQAWFFMVRLPEDCSRSSMMPIIIITHLREPFPAARGLVLTGIFFSFHISFLALTCILSIFL